MPLRFLVILIFATFLTGGSSRADVESLIILRPLSVIAFGIAIWTLQKRVLKSNKILLALIIFFVLLHIIYLLPIFAFQENVFDKLQFQNLIFESSHQSNYPIAVNPISAQNSFFSIILPISVLLLAVQISTNEQIIVLKLILFLGCLSAIFGTLQIIGDGDSFFYLYRISNIGSSVGLFANRNHQGVFLGMLFPMFAAYAALRSPSDRTVALRNWVAISCGAVLIPLILITGSRGGLMVGLIAISSSFFLYGSKHSLKPKNRKWQISGVLAGIAGLCLWTVVMSRAEAWDRLFDGEEFADGRGEIWSFSGNLVSEYFPLGVGPGGFSAAFTSAERVAVLDPTYLNHAHNDWLEWVVTFGLPGMVFLLAALGLFLFSVVQKSADPDRSSSSGLLLKLGFIIIVLVALASVGDYPVRTPIISCVFALALCWTMGKNPDSKSEFKPLQAQVHTKQRTSSTRSQDA